MRMENYQFSEKLNEKLSSIKPTYIYNTGPVFLQYFTTLLDFSFARSTCLLRTPRARWVLLPGTFSQISPTGPSSFHPHFFSPLPKKQDLGGPDREHERWENLQPVHINAVLHVHMHEIIFWPYKPCKPRWRRIHSFPCCCQHSLLHERGSSGL